MEVFREAIARWSLVPDGDPILTAGSALLPVLRGGRRAMLKIAVCEEERRGNRLMTWWEDGVAPVIEAADDALLMARAEAFPSLAPLALCGCDEQATRILCRAGARLHARSPSHPDLTDLEIWFRALTGPSRDGMFAKAAKTARGLLAGHPERSALHGDLHHGNLLWFGTEWLAIDPKGLIGDPAFDFVNILRNPGRAIATSPDRLARHAAIICEETGVDRERLLGWAFAFFALSACWEMEEGQDPGGDLELMEIVKAILP